ncbi:MAG: bifunctional pyr operon transcriptional regulator/uracil phosphoribosyltransferase PyrR [bacterium]
MKTTPSRFKAQIMDAPGMSRTLARLANEIIESNRGVDKLVFVGIRTRGVEVAQRLIEKIEQFEGRRLPLGSLDVTLYRDDLSYNQHGSLRRMKKSRVQATDIPFDLEGKIVILVDDVLYTGRTIRAALDALMDFGRPAKIRLAVIIDRGHRELPIRADFTGKEIVTTPGEEVRVKLANVDGAEGVDLVEVLEEGPA